MKVVRLVECSDSDFIYGYIAIGNETISVKMLQDKIYEIKNSFYAEGFTDWTVGNILEELPENWNCTYYDDDGYVEV